MTSITYEWTLQGPSALECRPVVDGNENVVTTVHWRLNGSDGTYGGTTCGAQAIPYQEGESFTPYSELTEEIVIGWAKDAMGSEMVAAAEGAVADQIAVQANPPVVTPPLPWAEPSE